MKSFPFFFKLEGVPCLVVGGGEGARHKANLLYKAGANVSLLAKNMHPSTEQFVRDTGIDHLSDSYQKEHLEGFRLVIAAEEDELNRNIAQNARDRGIFVNAVDMPEISDFYFPSIVDRNPITIAIGSGGSSPVLVRHTRAMLETWLPPKLGNLGKLVTSAKDKARQKFPDLDMRRRFWDRHLQGRAAELVYSDRLNEAQSLIDSELEDDEAGSETKLGEVYLVGAGPGDPDLLTFKALRLMQQADVVLYDRLVSPEILEMVRRESELIAVGKGRNIYSITQENINESLADLALQGKRVLRLKGGDPFIFGRGAEELEHLVERGVPFQVVPGITAASGCASYAGIPLTHRNHAQSVRFITGHRVGGELNFDWAEFVKEDQTLVFYMGLNGLEYICNKLLEVGLPSDAPIALVEKGTRSDQRVFVSDISNLPKIVRSAKAEAPTLIIVGSVVKLHDQLNWWGGKQTDA
ncbi:MAG: uroporphyrinogen-III C-methyltransferase [Porticoccaceae bacterium]|jgi:uroporphyrin-III C-methyltransferase / precorrin-2 dehydrogenase / sirohydrochlorin ferrochelatase|nr:uroporphyrinogen-III C-methyltransferase [Porticoccaceae bacterium]